MRKTAGIVAAAALVGAAGGTVGALSASSTRSATRTITTAAAASGSAVAERSSALTVAQISKRDSNSVVEITSTLRSTGNGFPGGDSGASEAEGTGFVYDVQGDIVTNNHVVDGATSVHVKFPDGSTYTASIVGTDASTDLAIIHVDAPSSELRPLTLADSSAVAVGDAVVAIGNPFGLDNTVTSGIVSAVDRKISSPSGASITGAVQTDAAINHGNSGGPLLNLEGEVIGVTSQIESSSGGNEGVGFAIPSNTVRRVADQLLASAT
jgi:putative serine protease PepD